LIGLIRSAVTNVDKKAIPDQNLGLALGLLFNFKKKKNYYPKLAKFVSFAKILIYGDFAGYD
jgi:hypothetical protein